MSTAPECRARCARGHPATWMNAPLYVRDPGPVSVWASPLLCHCGARVWGNPPRSPR